MAVTGSLAGRRQVPDTAPLQLPPSPLRTSLRPRVPTHRCLRLKRFIPKWLN